MSGIKHRSSDVSPSQAAGSTARPPGASGSPAGSAECLTGPIECLRTPSTVTLAGAAAEGRAYLTLSTAAPADLPARLEVGSVSRIDAQRFRVATPGREWVLVSERSIVHHDAGRAFYAALPPRRVPLWKRMLWRLLLAAAGSRTGRWWLAR